jgi:four helix bundle protein
MSYRDLQVYQRAHALGLACHKLSLELPKYELYESGSQLRLAAKSVSANIVEGYGRKHYQSDYYRFLIIALASNDETAEWLRYIGECHPDLIEKVNTMLQENEEIGRMLNKLAASI